MTSPPYETPEGSYTPATISSMQSVSQSSIGMGKTVDTRNLLALIGDSFIANILSGFLNIGEAIGNFIGDLADALFGRYNGGHPVLEDIEQWQAENTGNWGPVIADYGVQLERKVEAWAVPTVSPLSQTINRRADPSFPLSSLLNPAGPITGSSGSAYGGDNDSGHSHGAGSFTVNNTMAAGADSTTHIYCAFITPAINRVYERLNFIVDEVTSPRTMDVAIYILDEDKILNRQLLVTNAGASIPTGRAVATVEFNPWVATQGSYIAVMWRQYGSGNTRRLLGLRDTPRPVPSSGQYFPVRLAGRVPGAGSAFPMTIDAGTTMDFTSDWFVPFAELSESTGEMLQHFTDDFNRDGYAGRPWAKLTGQAPWMDGSSIGVLQSLIVLNGPRIALYDQPLSSEDVHVEMQMTGPLGPQGTTWFAVRTTNTFLNGVGVFITNSAIALKSWNVTDVHNINGSATALGSYLHTLKQWDIVSCDYASGTFTVKVNGTTIFTVTGQTRGQTHRFLGIGFDRVNGDSPPRVAQWRAWDVDRSGEEGE